MSRSGCSRLDGRRVSLLDKYGYTEQDAKQLCREAGLLSPVYDFTDRGGCWFCPNARRRELRHLYDHHPDLWARMLELQALPGKVTEKFNRTTTFSEIDAGFRREDEQLSLWKKRRIAVKGGFMPNHITNLISFGDQPEQVAAFHQMLRDLRQKDGVYGSIDFNKLIPMPKALDIESGTRTTNGLDAYRRFITGGQSRRRKLSKKNIRRNGAWETGV